MSVDFSRYDDFVRLRRKVAENVGFALPDEVRARVVERLLQISDSDEPGPALKALDLLIKLDRNNHSAISLESGLLLGPSRVMGPDEEDEELGILVRVPSPQDEPDEEPGLINGLTREELDKRGAADQFRRYKFFPPGFEAKYGPEAVEEIRRAVRPDQFERNGA